MTLIPDADEKQDLRALGGHGILGFSTPGLQLLELDYGAHVVSPDDGGIMPMANNDAE